MKKIILSMLALSALVGCAKEELAPVNPDLVPIDLNAGVQAVTRAAVASGQSLTFSIAGWESKSTVSYSAATSWATTATVTANETAAGISWTAQKYYSADKDMKTYILAWYPQGTATAGIVSYTNTAADQDVMLADEVIGSKGTPAGALAFKHKTTQFKFEIQADASLTTGTKLKSIKIKDVAAIPTGFDFTKSDDARLTYATAATLAIPGISEPVISTTPAIVGDAVMIQPIGTKTLTLEVETDKGGTVDVVVTSADASFMVGKAYTVTLTFKQKQIDSNASVADWETSTGTGTVQ